MINQLDLGIYSLGGGAEGISEKIAALQERVALLRTRRVLSEETLRSYFTDRIFEQVAESNALEGSTLDAGETRLAIEKGITITGHDPAYVRDARALYDAHVDLLELAKRAIPFDLEQLHRIHSHILGGGFGAGVFRNAEVRISGQPHIPPRSIKEILDATEAWEKWSTSHFDYPYLVRATILHAWLTHIHPYSDGNGRTARAVTNLELIRAGHPVIIVRRKDRARYIAALAESDAGGDIVPLLSLFIERAEHALTDLERAANRAEGYDPIAAKLEQRQRSALGVWNVALQALVAQLRAIERPELDVVVNEYETSVELDEYIALCKRQSVGNQWWFSLRVAATGISPVLRLAWIGFRSPRMTDALRRSRTLRDAPDSPSIFWSEPNPNRYPRWRSVQHGPGADEMCQGPDGWILLRPDNEVELLPPSQVATRIVEGMLG